MSIPKPELPDLPKPNKEWFEHVKPTFIENWPRALCNMSVAQVDIPLTMQETKNLERLVSHTWNVIETTNTFPDPTPFWREMVRRLDAAVTQFPHGAFVRLGSRSPKDSPSFDFYGGKCESGRQALEILCGMSERVLCDLWDSIGIDYPAHVFVREYLEIPKWSEFRCFMRERRLVGVSQYYYHQEFEELSEKLDSIRWAIGRFFEDFSKACHLDDVVFDVFVRYSSYWEVKLLEINPFGQYTDPCLFDWRNGGDFDGSTKVFKET